MWTGSDFKGESYLKEVYTNSFLTLHLQFLDVNVLKPFPRRVFQKIVLK